jgi:hypothetical protein
LATIWKAREYLLVHDGRTYDTKAIVGAAHGFLEDHRPLKASEFSGGQATVGQLLRRQCPRQAAGLAGRMPRGP